MTVQPVQPVAQPAPVQSGQPVPVQIPPDRMRQLTDLALQLMLARFAVVEIARVLSIASGFALSRAVLAAVITLTRRNWRRGASYRTIPGLSLPPVAVVVSGGALSPGGTAGGTAGGGAESVLGRGRQTPGAPGAPGAPGTPVEQLQVRRPVDPVAISKEANGRYRAVFLINAARRVQGRVNAGQDLLEAIDTEIPNWRSHLVASDRRLQAARQVRMAALAHGRVLGWYAVMDERTTAECRAADHRNFRADLPPVIGYPGGVHPRCRCRPGPPWPSSGLVDDSLVVRRAGSATGFEKAVSGGRAA